MSDFITAIILGIIEGITEFLPVSSTGHLIIANQWINLEGDFGNKFNIIIQFGAILAVVLYFWNKLYPFSSKKSSAENHNILNLWKKTIIGVIPAIILGALFDDLIEHYFFNPVTVSIMLFIGGIVLIILENRNKRTSINTIKDLTYRHALLIGLFQCLAMIPGTSRSAATIIGAMLLGASRKTAAEFSFFLAIPTMAAATAYSLLKVGFSMSVYQWGILSIGFLVSFVVAYAVIASFMQYISKRDFKIFGYYRIILAIIILLLMVF